MAKRKDPLKSMSLEQILNIEGLPKRLIVYFASQCAKDAIAKLEPGDRPKASVEAIAMAEAYGNGQDFDQAHMTKVTDAAYAATAADSVTHYAPAALYAAAAAHFAAANAAANSAAYSAHYATYPDHYKPLLLDLINKRLTKVEKLLILGIEE